MLLRALVSLAATAHALRATGAVKAAQAELAAAIALRADDAPTRVAHASCLWVLGRGREAARHGLRVALLVGRHREEQPTATLGALGGT